MGVATERVEAADGSFRTALEGRVLTALEGMEVVSLHAMFKHPYLSRVSDILIAGSFLAISRLVN